MQVANLMGVTLNSGSGMGDCCHGMGSFPAVTWRFLGVTVGLLNVTGRFSTVRNDFLSVTARLSTVTVRFLNVTGRFSIVTVDFSVVTVGVRRCESDFPEVKEGCRIVWSERAEGTGLFWGLCAEFRGFRLRSAVVANIFAFLL